MTTSASKVTGAKRINSTLEFSDLRPMKGIRHLRESKKKFLKSVFFKIVEESNSSERMNVANSAIIEPTKLVSFGHLPMETDNVGRRSDGIVATRIEHSDRTWSRTDRYDKMAHTHDYIETIREK